MLHRKFFKYLFSRLERIFSVRPERRPKIEGLKPKSKGQKLALQSFKGYRCEKGASLVEFALVLPILLTIIFTTLELGIMLTIKVNLQSCTQIGAYYGEAGSYTAGSTRTASAQAGMLNGVSGLLNSSRLTIAIQSYPDFATASLGGAGISGTGNPGQVGKYQMQYLYSPSSPLVAAIFGYTHILQSTTYVKNEEIFPS